MQFTTSGFSPYIAKSKADTFIIGTEVGMIFKLKKDHPTKRFVMPTAETGDQSVKVILNWLRLVKP